VLRIIFEHKRDKITMEWRKLFNEELNDLYSSPNTFRVIKSRRMRWAGHVARMGERRGYTRFWWENLRERDNLGYPGVDGKILLRLIFRKWNEGGKDWIDLAQGTDRWRAFVNAVMNFLVPQNAENFLTSCNSDSFSRRTLLHVVSK